jgi:hypothetical protein
LNPFDHARALRDCFASDYADARTLFVDAAAAARTKHEVFLLPGHVGAHGEALSMDLALLEPDQATGALLVLSSGVHGLEGFCGSGCQVAMLRDEVLLASARQLGISLLFVHAVNPYGFSHRRRVNEDNVDLNRNFIDFDQPPENAGYAKLHGLLLPPQWPPSAQVEETLAQYIRLQGDAAYRAAAMTGQSTHPDGLFYTGREASWSHRTLREVVRRHACDRPRIAWMDVHTGLGPYGHCEKIHAGPVGLHANLAMSRAVWGSDVFAPWDAGSVSAPARGNVLTPLFTTCSAQRCVGIGLEFGGPVAMPLDALRAEQWLHRNPAAATPEQRASIRQDVLDVFYVDSDDWRGRVWGQYRSAVVQALNALGPRGTAFQDAT